MSAEDAAAVDLYWLPLGAGGKSVRINGRVFEFFAAGIGRRPRRDLYHSALIVTVDGERHTIEMAPVWSDSRPRGVACSGAVGSNWLGRLRLFQYEVRCWRDGEIPDVDEAVESPRRLSSDPRVARAILAQTPTVPTPVWGRDELRLGEMWNSNSVISWLIESGGLDARAIDLPMGGRAPGWDAGWSAFRRDVAPVTSTPRRAPD